MRAPLRRVRDVAQYACARVRCAMCVLCVYPYVPCLCVDDAHNVRLYMDVAIVIYDNYIKVY